MRQFVLGPVLRAVLSDLNKELDHAIAQGLTEPGDIRMVQNLIDRIVVAPEVTDIFPAGSPRLVKHRRDGYRLQMNLKWKGPLPVSLDLGLVKDSVWELELVFDDPKRADG